jgi:hypothetical protein
MEGAYVPWIGARLEAEVDATPDGEGTLVDDVEVVGDAALCDEMPGPPDETQPVLSTTSSPNATGETNTAGETRRGRFTRFLPSLDMAIVRRLDEGMMSETAESWHVHSPSVPPRG